MSERVRFLGVELEHGPGALRPREETELCGRTAIDRLRAMERAGAGPATKESGAPGASSSIGTTVIDVCCGTGNLACAIAAALPAVRAWALDLTDGAVELARRNVARLGLGDRVQVGQGDLFAALGDAAAGLAGAVDLITCNPPYISTAKLAERADLAGEPREAFDGGPYGLTIHQRVAREALLLLRPGGWLVMEHGLGQERQVQMVLGRAGGYDRIDLVTDEAGAPRVVAARRR